MNRYVHGCAGALLLLLSLGLVPRTGHGQDDADKHLQRLVEDLASDRAREAALRKLVGYRRRAVPLLVGALHKPELVPWAVMALGRMRDRSLAAFLLPCLEDGSDHVRALAAAALGETGNPVAVLSLCRSLSDPQVRVRSNAARALGLLMDDRAVDGLIKALRDKSYVVRFSASRSLVRITGQDRGEKAEAWERWNRTVRRRARLERLFILLTSPDRSVAGRAERELLAMGQPAVPILAETTRHRKPGVRLRAMRVLRLIGRRDGCLDHPAGVRALLEALEDAEEKVAVRCEAAQALGMLKHERSLPTLVKALGYPSESVRIQVVGALARHGKTAVEAVLGLLRASGNVDGESAAQLIHRVGRAGLPLLLSALKEENPYVIEASVLGLGLIGGPRATRALLGLLRNPNPLLNPAVLLSALESLGPPAVPALIALLPEGAGAIPSRQVVRTLVRIGDVRAVPALMHRLDPDDHGLSSAIYDGLERLTGRRPDDVAGSFLRWWRTEELPRVRRKRQLALLLRELRNPSRRHRAARALKGLGASHAVPALLRSLTSTDVNARQGAEIALRTLGADGVPALLALLDDHDAVGHDQVQQALVAVGAPAVPGLLSRLAPCAHWRVRRDAAFILGLMKEPRALGPLGRCLADASEAVREGAVEALAVISLPQARAMLLKALSDRSLPVRRAAVLALGRVGGREALAGLARLYDDFPLREDVEWAVRQIGRREN